MCTAIAPYLEIGTKFWPNNAMMFSSLVNELRMITLPFQQLALICVSVLSISLLLVIQHISKPLDAQRAPKGKQWRLPPGPAGSFLVGNLLQMRRARRDEICLSDYLSSLAQYGEMTTLRIGSKVWVLLNSGRVVSEIIAKRGNITHERPHMPIASGLVGGGNRFVLQHTPRWTEARRVSQPLLTGAALNTFEKLQELESVHLLAAYLYKPNQWHSHHFRYCVSVIHRIILGEGLLKSSPELDDLQRVTTEFLRSINASVVDFFPKLAKLPVFLQPWRSQYLKMGLSHREVFEKWWTPVKEAIARDTAPPSFVRDVLLHDATNYTGTDVEAMYIAMSTISAGSDNPRMAMNVFVMAMLCNPDIMQKARDEIDKVCGRAERLPCFGDMAALPYVCALVKEVLRWRPTVPLIPQHQLIEDLDFEGYMFPAGTEFVINGIAVGDDYEHPDMFEPQRWLDGNEGNVTHGLWHFGGGRRICIGYRLGQKELFIAFARLLCCFNYTAAGPYDNRRLRHHVRDEPFPVLVTVRSEEHRRLIIGEATHAGVLESAKMEFYK